MLAMRRSFYNGCVVGARVVSSSSIRIARELSINRASWGGNSLAGSTVWEGEEIHFCNSPGEAFNLFLRLNSNIIAE